MVIEEAEESAQSAVIKAKEVRMQVCSCVMNRIRYARTV